MITRIKNEARRFWRTHKKTIIYVGGSIVACGAIGIACKQRSIGAQEGVNATAIALMDYLDEIYPEEGKAEEWYRNFRNTCPEVKVQHKIF